MLLPKHPDLMSDEELREWVRGLVARETPESIFLDYKQTIATRSRSDKCEIAKDVSSFANERGGVVLYGIPEKKGGSGEPIPVKSIGMAPIPGLLEVIENILVDTLTPTLPELRARKVVLEEPPDKVVYLAWHPESWEAPHMIHAYGERRYYKRGNFRAVIMEEGEVERLYVRRQSRRTLSAHFLQDADFGESLFSPDQLPMRFVVCPAFPFENRWDFSRESIRQWLGSIIPHGGSGWRPFSNGVRFFAEGEDNNWVSEVRLFRNGALSRCTAIMPPGETTVLPGPGFLARLDGTLSFAGAVYRRIGMIGNLLIDMTVLNMKEVPFNPRLQGYRRQLEPSNQLIWRKEVLHFQVAASAIDLLIDEGRWALEKRIMDRLTQHFGIWTIPAYFKDNGSPAYQER